MPAPSPTSSTTSSPTSGVARRADAFKAGSILLVMAGLIYAGYLAIPSGNPTTAAESKVIVMPMLNGLSAWEAVDVLGSSGIDWVETTGEGSDFHDLSYLHRDTGEQWKVWSTIPHAGHELEPGEEITMFALPFSEYRFFRENRRMPKAPWRPGTGTGGYWEEFSTLYHLAVKRFDPNFTPKRAPRPVDDAAPSRTGLPHHIDLSHEPRSERRLRNGLREARRSDLFVTTIPKPGRKLRPGQSIVVLYRPRPAEHPELYPNWSPPTQDEPDDWDVYISPDWDDDDDDWDVPGWLCPTRFC